MEVSVGPDLITLHLDDHVLVCDPDGRLSRDAGHGFFAADTRFVSGYRLRLGNVVPVLPTSGAVSAFGARFEFTNPPLHSPEGNIASDSLDLRLERSLGGGLHEDYDLVNYRPRTVDLTLEVSLECDFVDRALDWIELYGDVDGDGYVEYHRATPQGLANQGWKDSWDGIRHGDGRVAEPPIDSSTSNPGHCLWTGIVDPALSEEVAGSLMSEGLFSGWGLRTLDTGNTAYNPLSYHRGSVWPHDTAIAAAGLARYGHHEAAARLSAGLLEASAFSGGRLPELFAGFGRDDLAAPVPYPSSCSPQAWAAGTPLLVIRSLLGIDPDIPGGTVRVRSSAGSAFEMTHRPRRQGGAHCDQDS